MGYEPPAIVDRDHPPVTQRRVASAVELAAMRAWVDAELRSADVAQATIDDATLALTELVSNGLTASPAGGHAVDVTVEVVGDEIVLSVRNRRGGAPLRDVESWGPADPTSENGRGLHIVRSIMGRVEVRNDDDWTTVVCALDAD